MRVEKLTGVTTARIKSPTNGARREVCRRHGSCNRLRSARSRPIGSRPSAAGRRRRQQKIFCCSRQRACCRVRDLLPWRPAASGAKPVSGFSSDLRISICRQTVCRRLYACAVRPSSFRRRCPLAHRFADFFSCGFTAAGAFFASSSRSCSAIAKRCSSFSSLSENRSFTPPSSRCVFAFCCT